MLRLTLLTLLAAAGVYTGLCLLMFVLQRSLIYFPAAGGAAAPGASIELPTEAGPVRVLTHVALAAQPSAPGHAPGEPRPVAVPALLYFGGNAEDVRHSLPDLARAFPGHALYLMQYRGYGGHGGSAGSPSEAALVADALALYDRVQPEHPRITVIGRSLGSGVAVQLAAARPAGLERLLLVTPYDSLAQVAARHYPWLPVRWLLRDRFESCRAAPAIRVPTLLLAAEHDDVIPRRHSEALLACFSPGVASLQALPGTDHNSISQHRDYLKLLGGSR